MLTLTVVLIASSTYGSLVNHYVPHPIRVHIVSTRLFYVGVQSIHRFMDGKHWNEVFLYPRVSKAISRSIPQNVGLCHL